MTDRLALSTEDMEAAAVQLLAAHRQVDAEPVDVVALLSCCQLQALSAGQVVCREGDAGDALFVLLEGRVRVEKRDVSGQVRAMGEVVGPTLLGQMAMIDRARRSATCVATSEGRLATLDRDTYRTLVRSNDPRGTALRRLLLSSLTLQLVEGNARLRQLIEEARPAPEASDATDSIGGALLAASGLLEGWMPNSRPRGTT